MSTLIMSYHACPKCGGINDLDILDTIEGFPCDVSTECRECNYIGYWSYGCYEDSPDDLHELVDAVTKFRETKTTGDMHAMFDLVDSITKPFHS